MKRVTEPELMESVSQVRAYSDADFSISDSKVITGIERLLKNASKEVKMNTLFVDLGCGPGNISERLIKRWPQSNVIGIDGSTQMILEAEERKKGLDADFNPRRLSYKKASIKEIETGKFLLKPKADILVSNSLIHHLHNPIEFWNALKALSNEKTTQFHRDLRRPNSEAQAFQILDKYLANAPIILKNDFLASLKAAFTVKEIQQQLQEVGLSHFKVLQVEEYYLEITGTF